jgi:hypothetical protein
MVAFVPNKDCNYKYDYSKIADRIKNNPEQAGSIQKSLILDDLFFIVCFIMEIPGANNPFVVDACREVEKGNDYIIYLWAREHFKTSIITIAQTVQYALKNPDSATGILSATRPLAKKILTSIKQLFENNQVLKDCFPDIVHKNPKQDGVLWSLDEGLYLNRSTTRKEATISAWGLIDGMPTGQHFNRMVYDDIVVEDHASSFDTMVKVIQKFDSSINLGTDGGHHVVVGTHYHDEDPLNYIKKKTYENSDKKRYYISFKPATHNGERDGKPVFLSQQRLDDLKLTKTFNCQQLLDPSPSGDRNYNRDMIHPIDPKFIPKNLFKVMLIDQAGDNVSGDGDPWAIELVGVEMNADNLGISNVYILDLIISQFGQTAAIEAICRMYLAGGIIKKLGVEKVGLSTTEVHIANALKKSGRILSVDHKNLVLLKPAGRSKEGRVVSNLDWPLLNKKTFYSTAIPNAHIEKAKSELDRFPYCSYHWLDAHAYLYDILNDPLCNFVRRTETTDKIAQINKRMPKYAGVHMGRR